MVAEERSDLIQVRTSSSLELTTLCLTIVQSANLLFRRLAGRASQTRVRSCLWSPSAPLPLSCCLARLRLAYYIP